MLFNYTPKQSKSLHLFLLFSFLISLPFTIKLNNLIIILAAINSLFIFIREKRFKTLEKSRFIYICVLVSFFLIHLISIIYADSFGKAWFSVEKKFSLLAFPLIFGLNKSFDLSNDELLRLKQTFLAVMFITSIVLLIKITPIFSWHNYDLEVIETKLLYNRPYLGLHIVFAITIIFCFFKKSTSYIRLMYSIIFLVLSICLLVIYAKMAIISLVLSTLIILLILLHRNSSAYFYAFLFIVLFCILTILTINEELRSVAYKIINWQNISDKVYEFNIVNSFNERFLIWNCSLNLLQQDYNWIIGMGVSDYQVELDKCYTELKFENWMRGKNPHNQVLSILLNVGVTGLLLILINISQSLKLAFRSRNYFWMFFLLTFIFCSLSETMLAVHKGVVYFAFFNSIFLFNHRF